jgi:hypothetical protein
LASAVRTESTTRFLELKISPLPVCLEAINNQHVGRTGKSNLVGIIINESFMVEPIGWLMTLIYPTAHIWLLTQYRELSGRCSRRLSPPEIPTVWKWYQRGPGRSARPALPRADASVPANRHIGMPTALIGA